MSRIREDSLLSHVTMISHNSYLFKGTVRENLLMAAPMATEIEMETVLKKVNLYEFLKSQRGLDTELMPATFLAASVSGWLWPELCCTIRPYTFLMRLLPILMQKVKNKLWK